MSRRFLRALGLGFVLPSLLLVASAAPVSAARATHYVDDDGTVSATSCDGTDPSPASVQAAINSANRGDVIKVCPGEYTGRITINKRVTVRGVSPFTASIVAAPGQDVSKPLVWIRNTVAAKVFWLNINAPADGDCEQLWYGVLIENAPFTSFRANHLGLDGGLGLECGYGVGIFVSGGSRKSDIAWNTLTDFGYSGIGVSNSKRVNVYGNTLNYFHAGYAPDFLDDFTAGIQVDGKSFATKIGRNHIRSLDTAGATTPRLDTAVRVLANGAKVIRNTIHDVKEGVLLGMSGPIVHSNNITDTASYGFNVAGATNGIIRDNISTGFGGIFVSSGGNTIRNNNFDAQGMDCWDTSTGSGTMGTGNTWINNIGPEDIPDGICQSGSSDT